MSEDTTKVCKTCGKSSIILDDKFKRINPDYVGLCQTCMVPITEAEMVTRTEYLRLSRISDQIGGDVVN